MLLSALILLAVSSRELTLPPEAETAAGGFSRFCCSFYSFVFFPAFFFSSVTFSTFFWRCLRSRSPAVRIWRSFPLNPPYLRGLLGPRGRSSDQREKGVGYTAIRGSRPRGRAGREPGKNRGTERGLKDALSSASPLFSQSQPTTRLLPVLASQ